MNKIIGIGILLFVFASMICGTVAADNSVGPAPNSGDGIPDGSGFDQPTILYTLIIIGIVIFALIAFFLFRRSK